VESSDRWGEIYTRADGSRLVEHYPHAPDTEDGNAAIEHFDKVIYALLESDRPAVIDTGANVLVNIVKRIEKFPELAEYFQNGRNLVVVLPTLVAPPLVFDETIDDVEEIRQLLPEARIVVVVNEMGGARSTLQDRDAARLNEAVGPNGLVEKLENFNLRPQTRSVCDSVSIDRSTSLNGPELAKWAKLELLQALTEVKKVIARRKALEKLGDRLLEVAQWPQAQRNAAE